MLTFSERHLKMEAHSEKFMNVSDLQTPNEDDRHDEQSRSNTIKAVSWRLRRATHGLSCSGTGVPWVCSWSSYALTPARLEALSKLSVVAILSPGGRKWRKREEKTRGIGKK